MIRLFSKLCKHFKQISFENEIDIFNEHIKSVSMDDLVCSSCGAKHSMSVFAYYKRNLTTYDNNTVCNNMVTIPRCICFSCNHTHAILPSVIVPYLSFSFKFIVSIIYDYVTGKFNSIEAMCKHYEIAVSTFYRILNKFKEHKKLWLGLLEDKITSILVFLENLKNTTFIEIENFIEKFFNKNGLSFFQETS